MEPVRDFIIGLGGESGEGVVLAGDILNITAARMNVHSSSFRTFPAEARGGPSVVKIRLDRGHVYSLGDDYDVLIAFNEDAYKLHGPDLTPNGVLLIDGDPSDPITERHPELKSRTVYQVPMDHIARKEIGDPKAKNMVAVGAAAALFGFSREMIEASFKDRFAKRNEQMYKNNLAGFVAGYEFATTKIQKKDPYCIEAAPGEGFMVLSGNEAVALGSLYAGCRFFGGYPITPASEIMEILAAELPKVGGAMVQLEDEIASIGAVLGASFAGAPSMTATSGPGLSLMAELIGLGSMAEIPCVIVDVQRGGPSTGLPTKTEQADLSLALVASHGDAPHVVLAATTIRDCFEIMPYAFEIAERYQIPVIVLTDQALGFRRADLPKTLLTDRNVRKVVQPTARTEEDGRYLRYKLTADGVSPRAIPGMPNLAHVVTGLEHGEDTKPAYDPPTRCAQMEKRQRKLDGVLRDYRSVLRYGDAAPEIGVIGWGSTAGPVREAVELACQQGIKAAGMVPRMLYPSPNDELRDFVKSCKKVIVVEGNLTGQYATFLKSQIPGFEPLMYNRYDGLPVRRLEVLQKIQEVAR